MPWHYSDRIAHLHDELDKIISGSFNGELKKHMTQLINGVFDNGVPIVTEVRRCTCSTSGETSVTEQINKGKELVINFAQQLKTNLSERVKESRVITLMRGTFHEWKESSLEELLEIANSSGRMYGLYEDLLPEYNILKERYADTRAVDEMGKWLMMYTKKNLYKDIPNILHFALCCFTKAPLEAPAETIGSVISQHGRKSRYSLLPSSLSNEVQVAWNEPEEFQPATKDILDEALELHFKEKQTGVRFYSKHFIRHMSTTVKDYYLKQSRIYF